MKKSKFTGIGRATTIPRATEKQVALLVRFGEDESQVRMWTVEKASERIGEIIDQRNEAKQDGMYEDWPELANTYGDWHFPF